MIADSLYRISFKCLVVDESGNVLVVKERGRSSWDLPGGGIEHGETIEESIARELYEEVAFKGSVSYRVLKIDNPIKLLTRDVWQVKIILLLAVSNFNFSIGDEADDVRFIDINELKDSDQEPERIIYEYMKLATESDAIAL